MQTLVKFEYRKLWNWTAIAAVTAMCMISTLHTVLYLNMNGQRKGISRELLEYSLGKASELGFDVIVIFGNPGNYVSRGFKSCKKYNVCLDQDVFSFAMFLKELKAKVLDGRRWYYHQSSVYNEEF